MAFAAGPLALAGTAVSAIGAIQSGLGSSSAASYQAQVAANNAVIARQNAEYAAQAGTVQAETAGLEGAQREGQIKTSQAANNIDVNSGSAVNVQVSEKESDVLNQSTTMNNALLKAYGYQTQAVDYQAQSQLSSAQSYNDLLSGGFTAAGDLFTGGSKAFSLGGLS